MNRHIMILILVSLSIAGCDQITFESKWIDQEIIVDGKLTEWQDKIVVPKNSHMGIGFMNDEHYLYLTLTTMDRNTIMQVLTRGFTVWIDPKGGKKHHLGFKYPMNRNMGDFRLLMQNREQNSQDFDFFIHELLSGQNEIEITRPGKDQIARLGMHNQTGLNVKPMYENGVFTYEMKIPLKKSVKNMVAIDTKSGKKIGVGFTTQKLDRPSMDNKRGSRLGSGMSGGGMAGGGMGHSGGMGGRGGGRSRGSMGRNIPEEIDIWVEVSLSKNSN